MRKKLLPCLLLLFFLGSAGLLFWYLSADSFRFHRAADDLFKETLSEDALSLHYTLADPSDYGIHPGKAALPCYKSGDSAAAAASAAQYYNRLNSIRQDRLSKEDAYTCALLLDYLEQEIYGKRYTYYEEPLSPSSGTQSQLPLLLAEYTFRTKEDVDNYFSLLGSVPDYLESLLSFEKDKADAGFFMPDEDLEEVIFQCTSIITSESLREGSHFLQSTFKSRLENLSEDFSAEEIQSLCQKNDQILSKQVLPAYEKLADGLTLLYGSNKYQGGLAAYPGGKSYYTWLLSKSSASSRPPEEVMELLQNTFRSGYNQLKVLVTEYQSIGTQAAVSGNSAGLEAHDNPAPAQSTLTLASFNERFPLSEPEEILVKLQSQMTEDFPALSQVSEEHIYCQVKDVNPALEAYTSPAFYLTPPVDDSFHNTICINRASTSEGLDLYTTLAHEGYPGHLYQTVYSQLYAASQGENPVRELLYFGGYTEGWAYYTEMLSYEYAAQLTDQDSDLLLCQITSLQKNLQINLYCILDLSMHYYNVSKEKILDTLEAFGIGEESGERIYNYIRTEPANYLKYYLGYLEMLKLREQAENLWEEDFSLYKFHQFVLEAGPSDFDNLHKRLLETLEQQNALETLE